MKKAIVFAADSGYLEKLEVVMKSLCYYHTDLKFYILNDDLPSEWFQLMKKRLVNLNSEIVNVLIESSQVQQFRSPNDHIRYNTYFRYYIGEVVEEPSALYLDCDMIVNQNIDELFKLNLTNYYLASVHDAWDTSIFNAGMMVINVDKWRREKVLEQLLELTNKYHEVVYGDQGVLNLLFPEGNWLPLEQRYDVMVGYDDRARYYNRWDWYSDENWNQGLQQAIVHYEGPHKPWKQSAILRHRDLWWFYYSLEWSDIINRVPHNGWSDYIDVKYHTAIYTNSADMPYLSELIEALPEVQFHVLAYTDFAPWLYNFRQYNNVAFYPNMNLFQDREVFEKMDFYLDINRYDEIADITKRVRETGRLIFGFTETSHDASGESYLYEFEDLQTMVMDIRTYLRDFFIID